ncbi:tetratricopeptide repeat protein [Thiomicrorhabdus sp. 6S2-11]|uniref:Tetratricopeptide repeat protein n=1 Tax=Thiomicrorhabdus marina TaxID=2818442 RepID=A0ABS3Q7M1_9GAMM|nr:tetratricopeptide repeat protein [Thiomicrorhabdus marina]MBO1928251.1 tetratricopeptide repeat protein [Thiomicrorhabdus marina]
MQANIIDVTLENFQTTVIENSDKLPVLVDFWAPWCAPCKQVMPILEKLAKTHKDRFILAKVNTEEQQQLSEHFHIQSLPTFKICYQGKIVDSLEGVQTPAAFLAALEKYMPTDESENLRQKALVDIQLGNYESALAQLVEASQLNPNNFNIHLTIVKVYLAQGEISKALELAQRLPEDIQQAPEIKALLTHSKYIELAAEMPPLDTVNQQLASNSNNAEMLYALAIYQLAGNQTEQAMQSLLKLFTIQRDFNDDIARKTLLELFDSLKEVETELVNSYRRKLQNLLF